jgi:hypothetical protein
MSLLDGLISHWKLDEASGNALDAHGSNHLTDTNTVGTAAGKIGNARAFNLANNEYFTISDNAELSLTGDLTIAGWVRCDDVSLSSDQHWLSKWDFGTAQRSYMLRHGGSTKRFEFYVSSNGVSSTGVAANNFGAPSNGVWCFVVAWHDATNDQIGICVNNGTPNTVSHSTGIFDGNAPFRIGTLGTAGTYHWHGLLDEISIWSRVLTSDERTALYNSGNGLAYENFGGSAAFVDNTRNYLNCILGGVL